MRRSAAACLITAALALGGCGTGAEAVEERARAAERIQPGMEENPDAFDLDAAGPTATEIREQARLDPSPPL